MVKYPENSPNAKKTCTHPALNSLPQESQPVPVNRQLARCYYVECCRIGLPQLVDLQRQHSTW